MSSVDPLERLLAIKVGALLHDPPYKSLCIRKGVSHENEARELRGALVSGTPLSDLASREQESVKTADAIAAGFDRWLLSFRVATGVVVNSFANIFDPRYSVEFREVNFEEAKERAMAAVNKLRELIMEASNKLSPQQVEERLRLAYTVLYAFYEPLYYMEGVPPSPADNRVPTHTVFDHLYAAASVANLVLHSERKSPLSGFFVFVDFPGIHAFVGAARKAGDYWAGSWLISNVMWRLAEKLFDEFGPDVLISPTPRMNPYLYFGYMPRLLRRLLGGQGAEEVVGKFEGLAEKFFEELVGEKVGREVWLRQPLIPGMLLFVLPKGFGWTDSADGIKRRMVELFEEAWREVVDEALRELKSLSSKRAHRLAYSLLSSLRNVVTVPPAGIRVSVIDVEEVYGNLLECLRGKAEACSELGLNPSATKAREYLSKTEVRLEDVARMLAFHVAVVSAAKTAASSAAVPVPRSFWQLDGDKLKPVSEEMLVGDTWVPCTQCGAEPAVLRLRKEVTSEGIRHRYDDLRDLAEKGFLDISPEKLKESLRELSNELSFYFKPGEALGPYCLLKRALYMAKLSGGGGGLGEGFQSTDDVALEIYVSKIRELLGKNFVERVGRRLAEVLSKHRPPIVPPEDFEQACELVVRMAFEKPRDLEMSRQLLSQKGVDLSPEDYLRALAKSVLVEVEARYKQEAAGKVMETFLADLGWTDDFKQFLERARRAVMVREQTLLELLEPRSRFLIVYSDADNIGKLHEGLLSLTCKEYTDALLNLVRRGAGLSDEALRALSEAYELACHLLSLLLREGIAVSPAYKAALSLSLMITALKDVVTVSNRLGGMVIYAGGDDVVAVLPVDVLPKVLLLRKNYEGNRFFHWLRNVPIAPAPPFGRSMSVRSANLFDLLNEEIGRTLEALEEVAKRAEWQVCSRATWSKDSLVLTSSRSGTVAVLPMGRVCGCNPFYEGIGELAARLYAALVLGLVSSGLPEDFEARYLEALEVASVRRDALKRLSEYIIERNVSVQDEERGSELGRMAFEAGTCAYDALFSVFRKADRAATPLFTEILNVIKLMRVVA